MTYTKGMYTIHCLPAELNTLAPVALTSELGATVQPPQSWPQDRTDGGRTRFLSLKHPEAISAALDWAWR